VLPSCQTINLGYYFPMKISAIPYTRGYQPPPIFFAVPHKSISHKPSSQRLFCRLGKEARRNSGQSALKNPPATATSRPRFWSLRPCRTTEKNPSHPLLHYPFSVRSQHVNLFCREPSQTLAIDLACSSAGN
jgi:hypothetical protein